MLANVVWTRGFWRTVNIGADLLHQSNATKARKQASCQLPASGFQLPASGFRLAATGVRLSASGYRLPAGPSYPWILISLFGSTLWISRVSVLRTSESSFS